MVKMLFLAVWFLLLSYPRLTLLFNFDLRNPIVIHDRYDKADSQFGASVSLIAPPTGTGWIVIGAPKADSPLANYSNVQEPGNVWKCSLELDAGVRTCSVLEVDGLGEMDVKIGSVPKDMIHRDRKDFGRFGLTMSAGPGNSSRFIVCASRWTNQKYKEHHLMNGLCYWIAKEDLMTHDPPKVAPPDFSHRLLPLVNATRQAYTLATANGQLTERRFDWAFGQAGFSMDISKSGELLLGAPGVLEWAGSVVQYRDYDPIQLTVPWRRFNQKDSTFAQVLIPRAQTNINRKVINYFDYLGYAVTSGNFFKTESGFTQYAAGAPRGNFLNGKVLLFEFRDEPRELGGSPDESMHFLVEPIEGHGGNFFGSYFGSVLVAVDVNGDGLHDLVVGAPQYETTSPTFTESTNGSGVSENTDSSMIAGDEGCIFVYFSLGDDFGRTPQEICGDRPGARFGSALSNLGDLNHDGFEDLAIGAPYENENRGAVYVYMGSASRLTFSQKLLPEKLDGHIRGFGYSLSGNVDVDLNGYNDLAIGAYDSNHVVIYTSRAVVDISGNISSSVVALGSSTGNFTITTCCSYKGYRVPELEIWVKLSLDPELRKARIVEFYPDDRILPDNFSRNVITFSAKFSPDGKCHTFNATTLGDLDSVTVPVAVRQETWLEATDHSSADAMALKFELKKGDDQKSTIEQVSKQGIPWRPKLAIESLASKSLGPPIISIPILAICEEDEDPTCLANLTLRTIFKTTDGAPILPGSTFVIGSSKSVIVQIELKNHRERANLPLTVQISWSSPLTLRSSKSDCKRADLENGKNDKKYICSLLSPLGKGKKEYIELELDTTDLYAGKGHDLLTFHLQANTSSLLVQDAELVAELPLSHKSQLILLGQNSEVAYYENITAETVNFTQLYEMGVQGISPIYSVQLQVALPSGVLVGGRRLQLLRIREPIITYDGTDMSCHAPNGTFYKDALEVSNLDLALSTGRVKRSSPTAKKLTFVEPQPIIINCQTPGVDCLWVECEIFAFAPAYRALVEFRLRMITETARLIFAESDRELLIIESMSRLSRVVGVQEERFALARTLIRAEARAELKAWILIVAIGSGISIFTVITMILMHCGFFRRIKLEELTKLKARQASVFTFDDGLEMADSLEYYDGALTNSDFEYKSTGNNSPCPAFTDIYDEVK